MRSELLAFNMGKCKSEALYLPNGQTRDPIIFETPYLRNGAS